MSWSPSSLTLPTEDSSSNLEHRTVLTLNLKSLNQKSVPRESTSWFACICRLGLPCIAYELPDIGGVGEPEISKPCDSSDTKSLGLGFGFFTFSSDPEWLFGWGEEVFVGVPVYVKDCAGDALEFRGGKWLWSWWLFEFEFEICLSVLSSLEWDSS